ncbi:hypothetical protein CERSUDRAFT_100004 [Gelatoporia subvermispora B]|uniref:F-box domain-containing protein n=1 Tax=Ceriporiopsis subvermispora (strain B) TaxID=914234 RepID=M2P8P7_CERS8|nr:hypothetical protein CERSUDRAFT_100004 [Gelatoporia subvermispora B]
MDIALSPLVSEASFYTNADDLHSTVRQATKSGNYIFPALQALQLHVDRIFILPAVLSAIHSSSLTTLSLHFEDCDTTLDKIFGTLGCSSAQHSLKTLALDALGIMDDPQVPTVTCKTLKDVARLKALQNLWLWIPKIMLDEKELPATLFTFPEGLSDLYIYTCQSDGLPLDALQHFASCCPQVKLLGLTLNAQPVLSHLPQNWLSASRLEYLNLENAPVVRPGETGKYLSALFPRMGLVQLERLSGSPTREERLQICRAMEEAAGGDMIVDGDMKSCSTPSDREARYWNVFEWV